MKKFKSSRLSRIATLGGTIAKVGGQIALDFAKEKSGQIIEKSLDKAEKVHATAQQIKAAQQLILSMGELKGGFMKVGQMLSITEDLILPKEISELFKTLQKDSPKMSSFEIDQVFLNEFKKSPNEVFKSFNYEAIAAASIGQVHKAILHDGTEVAVKVQYPKIADAVKSDLQNIHQLDKLLKIIFPDKPHIDHILKEIKETMLNECDYRLEAKNIEHFQETFKGFPNIIIPKVFKEYSNEKILTTEYMCGDHFDETVYYDQKDKDFLGKILYESYLFAFFNKKMLHTDPQEGNYLFHKDKIIMFDFGSVKYFEDEFVEHYALMTKAISENDIKLYRISTEYLNVTQSHYDDETIKKYMHVASEIYRPFLKEGKYAVNINPFQIIKSFIGSNFKDLKGKKAPRQEFVLLDRANIGIFTKLSRWNSKVNWIEGRTKYQSPTEEIAFNKHVKDF